MLFRRVSSVLELCFVPFVPFVAFLVVAADPSGGGEVRGKTSRCFDFFLLVVTGRERRLGPPPFLELFRTTKSAIESGETLSLSLPLLFELDLSKSTIVCK